MKCMHAREHLPDNVFEFLGVKDPADKRSLLQIFVDNYQLVVAEKKNQSDVRDNKQPNEVVGNSTQCTICLTNVEMNTEHQHEGSGDNPKTATDSCDAPIILPCNHSFHRKCIFQWLQFEFHCPVCRALVLGFINTVVNMCFMNRAPFISNGGSLDKWNRSIAEYSRHAIVVDAVVL
ncbi:RING finger ubiquitin ligase [Phytophthora megakarya]|uniref:RING finger ubiquitin ligase n=1 Tax=Phytophthora megakarya TaxID=4795 RepID=A0A225VEE9_9STRA|nr:RING finger ubiquitin ligase [Phytophthora megakarya]